jgi:hypothetical protein
MDTGASIQDGLMWVFTRGCPSEKLIASFGKYLESGEMSWVIIPMHTAQHHHPERSWPSDSASS